MARLKKKRVQATSGGAERPIDHPQSGFAGPTAERLSKSQGHFVVGDDQMGHRVYQFLDTPLARLYSRLVKAPDARLDQLRKEYTALQKYGHHWQQAGREASLPSVDPGRSFSSDPSNFSGMAKTERQHDHRLVCRVAREELARVYGEREGHRYGIVLDNIMGGWDLRDAGGMIGYRSPFRAREIAETAVRGCGKAFIKLWGIG